MGYQDKDLINPFELFHSSHEATVWQNDRLRHRLRAEHGQPLFRLDQLEAGYDDLDEDPLIALEYDRFKPGVQRSVNQ